MVHYTLSMVAMLILAACCTQHSLAGVTQLYNIPIIFYSVSRLACRKFPSTEADFINLLSYSTNSIRPVRNRTAYYTMPIFYHAFWEFASQDFRSAALFVELSRRQYGLGEREQGIRNVCICNAIPIFTGVFAYSAAFFTLSLVSLHEPDS